MKHNVRNLIAVVEDDVQVLDALDLVLKVNRREVMLFRDGESFLASLGEKIPDVLLLDLYLPGINGQEVLNQFRVIEGTSHVKVVVVTAHPDSEEARSLCNSRVDQVLLKPFSEEALISAIELES